MKLWNANTESAQLDVVNAIDFLATVQRKERIASYHQSDYLRLKRKIDRSTSICYDGKLVLSECRYYQDHQKGGQWEMTMEGRIQVGQWFFKSKSHNNTILYDDFICHLFTYCSL